jgi:hypothetical protein
MFLSSCCAKKIAGKTEMHTIEVNKPISDHTFIPLPFIRTEIKECDSVCNEAVRLALANIGTAKTSGANSYHFNFDAFNDGFEIGANIGETRTEYRDREVVVEKKVYPWLIFLIIFVLGLFAGWKIKSIFAFRFS